MSSGQGFTIVNATVDKALTGVNELYKLYKPYEPYGLYGLYELYELFLTVVIS